MNYAPTSHRMKQIWFFILTILLVIGSACKRNKNRYVNQKLNTTKIDNVQIQRVDSLKLTCYTQFGKFITRITPDSFIGNLLNARYFNTTDVTGFGQYGQIVLFGPDANTPNGITVNFLKDSTINLSPKLTGNVYTNPDGTGGYYKEADVTFDLFHILMGFQMSITLPPDYSSVNLNQFAGKPGDANQAGRVIKTNQFPLNQVVTELKPCARNIDYYFGRVDTTYIGERPIPIFGGTLPTVRSTRYTPWTLEEPQLGHTNTIVSTLGFNFEKIIHIYAGADNIAYTADDIVVLEPKYWERLYLQVQVIKE